MKSINHIPHLNLLPSSSPFPLVLPTRTHTVPILQSCLLLLIFKLVFKGVSQCMPPLDMLYFSLFSPFHYTPPFLNSFQYTSLNPLPSQMLCFMILLMLYHSIFLSLFPQVPYNSSTTTDTFCICICICSCLFLCIYMFIVWIYLPCMRKSMWPLSF
jgi:hypothetical protein